ncbi:MAG: hypothetical protein VKI93_03930 [Synechococcus sp.]|nr:hypothetical protein [Synechococcus sp.]
MTRGDITAMFMHHFQLGVDQRNLLTQLVCVRQLRQGPENIFQGTFGVNQQSAISGARFNSHHKQRNILHSARYSTNLLCSPQPSRDLSDLQGA